MKIIAGEFRGRLLTAPEGLLTRPTMSQTRATVFNICQQFLSDCTFLDICAGSGSMGLEAISRGATKAIFIDQDRKAADAIRHNIDQLKVQKRSEVFCIDAYKALELLINRGQKIAICYFDPPYGLENSELLSLLDTSDLLEDDAFLFVEESSKTVLDVSFLQRLTLQSKRKIGTTCLYCFRK